MPNVPPDMWMLTLSMFWIGLPFESFPFHVILIYPLPPTTSDTPKFGVDGVVSAGVVIDFTADHGPYVLSLNLYLNCNG